MGPHTPPPPLSPHSNSYFSKRDRYNPITLFNAKSEFDIQQLQLYNKFVEFQGKFTVILLLKFDKFHC